MIREYILSRKSLAHKVKEALDDKELMHSLYIVSGLSYDEISNLLKTNIATVHKSIKKHGIASRPQGRGNTREAGKVLGLDDLLDSRATLASNLPASFSECSGASMPCPLVSCRYNTYLDVDPKTGAIIFNQVNDRGEPIPVEDVKVCNCSLMIANRDNIEDKDINSNGLLQSNFLAALYSTSRQGIEHIINEALAEALEKVRQWQ
jgi:hypothetical protein